MDDLSNSLCYFNDALDNRQKQVIKSFCEGRSVAILGGAGSGKTFALSVLLKGAKQKLTCPEDLAICGLTHSAAASIGGTTIHSLFGAPGNWTWSNEELCKLVCTRGSWKERLKRMKFLLLDEGMIMTQNEIEAIDFVFRQLMEDPRDQARIFGGPQLVIAGDPYQLEPVGVDDRSITATVMESIVWYLMITGYGDGVIVFLNSQS